MFERRVGPQANSQRVRPRGAAAPEGGSAPSCDKQEGVRPGRLPGTAWREPSNDNKRKQVTEFRRTPE